MGLASLGLAWAETSLARLLPEGGSGLAPASHLPAVRPAPLRRQRRIIFPANDRQRLSMTGIALVFPIMFEAPPASPGSRANNCHFDAGIRWGRRRGVVAASRGRRAEAI